MAKRLLIVKASDDVCATEIDHLKNIAEMFGMTHCAVELTDMDDFKKKLCGGDKYDYLYLAAHASPFEFGSADNKVSITWGDLSLALCEAKCLNAGAILLLGCCRGGLRRVAETLFINCDQIDYVCGPRWTVTSQDLTAGFHVFIYNMECRNEQPSTAVRRASGATGYDFFCYDRVEVEDRYEYIHEALPGTESGGSVSDAEPGDAADGGA
jgi:hypothetical protein